jgi:hypothetical protein
LAKNCFVNINRCFDIPIGGQASDEVVAGCPSQRQLHIPGGTMAGNTILFRLRDPACGRAAKPFSTISTIHRRCATMESAYCSLAAKDSWTVVDTPSRRSELILPNVKTVGLEMKQPVRNMPAAK